MVGYCFLDDSFIRNPMPVYPGANQPCRLLTPLPRLSQRDGRSCYPLDRRGRPVARTGWRPFRGRGVASPETPAPDGDSLAATVAQSGRGDRRLAGLLALLVRPTRLLRSAIALKPSTLLGLHKVLSKQKYRMLFSTNRRRKPGPKGPSVDLIHAVVEMKQRNPNWGCPRIAQQIALAFHIQIDKDVVRRILARHYRPGQDSGGPSWLTFLGHTKDSLWSMDMFRCESATLRTPLGPCGHGSIHTQDFGAFQKLAILIRQH